MPRCTVTGILVAKPEKREELLEILMTQIPPTRASRAVSTTTCMSSPTIPALSCSAELAQSRGSRCPSEAPHLSSRSSAASDELPASPVEMRFFDMLSEP